MPLIFNGTKIPENVANVLKFNGTNITKVIFNGVAVWVQNLYVGPTVGVYYGGLISNNPFTPTNAVTRINSSGTIIGSETPVGIPRYGLAGASIDNVGVYYGGLISNNPFTPTNAVTRINSSGTIIGSETPVGIPRYGLAGSGL